MAIKSEIHQFKGMQRDLSVSKYSPEYYFDAKNIRITSRDNNTLLSVTNERGNKKLEYTGDEIVGTYIGHATLNDYLILFTKYDSDPFPDRIFRITITKEEIVSKELYKGNLGFSVDNKLETLAVYENDNIQKVYWVDGINQSRVINIVGDNTKWVDTSFDFVPVINLDTNIVINKNSDSLGLFPSGVVQYAFSYYNLYGQESNIFYSSPLFYVTPPTRGASAEESVRCGFTIDIELPDANFDFIRIYSILRTSIDAVPTVKRIVDIQVPTEYAINRKITYTDTNTTGDTVDPTELLYKGGDLASFSTLTQKDNTLFLGNYTTLTKQFSEEEKEMAKSGSISEVEKSLYSFSGSSVYYPEFYFTLNESAAYVTTFKGGETYRLGIQAQDKTGRWSEVIFIKDYKVTNYPRCSQSSSTGSAKISYYITNLQYEVPSSLKQFFLDNGYRRVRGVIVYPSEAEREVICQGVIAPTVYNLKNRETSSPYAQSSWFFRPMIASLEGNSSYESKYGSKASWEDSYPIGASVTPSRSQEISPTFQTGEFCPDWNIVTLHSPEIEMGGLRLSDSDLKLRIIGSISFDANYGYRSITTETVSKSDGIGAYTPNVNAQYYNPPVNTNGANMMLSQINYIDYFIKDTSDNIGSRQLGWVIHPWHREGSITNDKTTSNHSTPYSKLKYNRTSNLRISLFTYYKSSGWESSYGITKVNTFDSDSSPIIKVPKPSNSNLSADIIYYGDIDTVLMPGAITNNIAISSFNTEAEEETSYNSFDYYDKDLVWLSHAWTTIGGGTDSMRYSNSPVSMRYKSNPHAVFAFNYTSDGKRYLYPHHNSFSPIDPNSQSDYLSSEGRDILWLGELYRSVENKFGGNTEEALASNIWTVAGDPVDLNISSTVVYSRGDTYFQRYDCLKTYPYSTEDTNNVTEILSFMCETHVNIDGRYDRNRGLQNNTTVSPTNFNLLNGVYSQKDNYFTNTYLSLNRKYSNRFPNTIAWSKQKTLGEETDTWTNITMLNTLDLDGDKGSVVSLNAFNNELYCFQERGFSNILFNSRVQIAASDGVPIEISNGFKVQGKRYISNSIGCNIKDSIVESPNGLYFIDDITNSIYLFNGQINSLSDKLGFRNYISTMDKTQVRSYYDRNNDDVYFRFGEDCLCYSELLGQFTSFMSYGKADTMFNIDNSFYSLYNNELWENFEGEYNMFYGEFKPYYITFISNSNESYDKVFNTLEFRADCWDNNTLLNNTTFDTLDVWDEYQHGTSTLTNIIGKPSPLKKKFRVWRANIPRDNSNKMNRIRNTWAYIKLSMNTPNTYRTELHDSTIYYYI